RTQRSARSRSSGTTRNIARITVSEPRRKVTSNLFGAPHHCASMRGWIVGLCGCVIIAACGGTDGNGNPDGGLNGGDGSSPFTCTADGQKCSGPSECCSNQC